MQLYKYFFRAVLPFLLVLIATNAWSFTFDWTALGWSSGSRYHHYINVNGSGVDVTVTVSGSTSHFFRDSSPKLEDNKLKLEVDFGHTSDWVTVTFTFTQSVTVANLRIWDIDSSHSHSSKFQDGVTVTAGNGNILPNPHTVETGSNVRTVSLGQYEDRGSQLQGSNDPRGRLKVDFNQQTITEFTVVYKPGTNSPDSPTLQRLFIDDFDFNIPAPPEHLAVTKTATPSGPVSSDDQIDYTITITNDGGVTQTGIVVNDLLPAGTSYVVQSTLADGFHAGGSPATFADDFSTGDYSGNWGSHDFSARWYEHDSDYHYSHAYDGHDGGYIRVTRGHLEIEAHNRGDYIYRQLDLSGSTSAILTYHFDEHLGDDDEIVVEVYDGSTWHHLHTYNKHSGSGNANFDIHAYISSHTQIRFRVNDEDDHGHLNIDNVKITAGGSSVSAIIKDNIPGGTHPDLSSGVPPTLVAAIDGFTLEPTQTMTVTYSVLVGATGRLTSIDNTVSVTSVEHVTPATSSVSNPLRSHDFGDAPATYGDASHTIKRPINLLNLYLGASTDKPDAEPGSQYSAAADGDDVGGRDDENGVTFTTDLVNHSVTATVTVNKGSGDAVLCGWLDFSGNNGNNGAFEASERHCQFIQANGLITETFTWGNLPTDRAYTTFARFRVSSASGDVHPTGNAADGEVEDYPLSYDFHVLDFGDAPASYGDPSHRIHQNLHMGAGDPDSENTTQYSAAADGDDNDGNDDENGVLFSYNATGTALTATVTVTNMTGADARLCGWLDGSFGTPNGSFDSLEGYCQTVSNNTNKGHFTFLWGSGGSGNVPTADSFARFRLSLDTSMSPNDSTTPNKGEGEVEDYFLPANRDFGDAPLLYGTPSHGVPATPKLYLGGQATQVPPDAESAHQPSVDAKGDDNNDTSGSGAGNDEDGFFIRSAAGIKLPEIRVFNSTGNPVRLCFWYDENTNGNFDTGEGRCTTVAADGNTPAADDIHCFPEIAHVTQCILTSNLWTPPTASATFARVRVTSDLSMNTAMPDGYFSDGEVNDIVDNNNKFDMGDIEGFPLSAHVLLPSVIKPPYIGTVAPDADNGGKNVEATFDDITDTADEEGVTFTSPAGTGHSIRAGIIVTNPGGGPVKLCGWLNQKLPLPDPVQSHFDAAEGQCKRVDSVTDCSHLGGDVFICFLEWSGLPADQAYTTYARFRVSTDLSLAVDHSPHLLRDGEDEDWRVKFDFTPTAVTIGKVELQALPAAAFLAGVGVEQMDDAALLALLEAWDPAAAASLAAADRDTIISALNQYLDPDGDGRVAVLAWDTLEERGTVGFYVERREGQSAWTRINNDMLPGLITAPMGGEYRLADPGVTSGSFQYRLIEQEARGTTRTYGPFAVEMP